MTVELRGLERLRLPRRRTRRSSEHGPALPLRRRARGRRARRRRPARGRGRLHARSRRRCASVGRAAASTCSRRSRRRSPTRSLERFAPERVRVRVRKPQVRPAGIDGRVQRRHRRAAVTLAYVGLGSNLGDREALIRARRRADRRDAASRRSARPSRGASSTSRAFLNAVAELETDARRRARSSTSCSTSSGGSAASATARAGGRGRSTSTCCSTATSAIDEPGLDVPHPRLHERRFVLEPLAELAPALENPRKRARCRTLLAGLQSAA